MLLAVLLPHMIVCESSTDSEKYQLGNPSFSNPSQSLYCNDLNPQVHLDFSMVIQVFTMTITIIRKRQSIMQWIHFSLIKTPNRSLMKSFERKLAIRGWLVITLRVSFVLVLRKDDEFLIKNTFN